MSSLELAALTGPNLSLAIGNETEAGYPFGPSRYSYVTVVIIIIVASFLSLLTVIGNIMVMVSFRIDKQLQTISNYYLFSLAVADFAVGLISMPLFTVYTVLGYWPLGPHVCDAWLALDYLASNASVLNLLIISFDRYFSVTRPLTYRAKRTTVKACFMIACAWGISLVLWPPWIYAWPYIEGKRTVPHNACYIQFIETNHYITFGTAIAAFYVPVTVMTYLYWRIWLETEKRQKDLPNLQAVKQNVSKRSNSSDEALDLEECKRQRSESSTGAAGEEPSTTHVASSYHDKDYPQHKSKHRPLTWTWLKMWCVAWWHSGREEEEEEEDEDDGIGGAESSRTMPGYEDSLTPMSVETPLTSVNLSCPSFTVLQPSIHSQDRLSQLSAAEHHEYRIATAQYGPPSSTLARSASAAVSGGRGNSANSDSVYTILIKLPKAQPERRDGSGAQALAKVSETPSIKMFPEDVFVIQQEEERLNALGGPRAPRMYAIERRPSQMPDVRIPLNAKSIQPATRQQTGPGSTASSTTATSRGKAAGNQTASAAAAAASAAAAAAAKKPKKKAQEKKADTKAARMLCAILATFVITWTPYNILVLLKPITKCNDCIPEDLWNFFYYLCYINSTINPLCYALCNANFRRTYLRIIKCNWHNRKRGPVSRGY